MYKRAMRNIFTRNIGEMQQRLSWVGLVFFLSVGLSLVSWRFALANLPAQNVSPETTGTAVFSGAMIVVNSDDQDEINVRAGPGSDYAILGKLLAGQQVPALGRSVGGDWVQISFPGAPGGVGWVYAYLVTVNSALPVVEPPPTSTPLVTPTVDKTLAAQFIIEIPPTRLPTFTPPPPLAIPTYPPEQPIRVSGGGQIVYLMLGLAVVGILGAMLSFLRIR